MPKRLEYKFVKEQFENEGYKLLSNKYINNHEKLDYICLAGHKHFTNWNNWKAGVRCPYCSKKAKLSLDFICSEFFKEGYVLLTVVYKNNKHKLKYVCSNGHEHSISWHEWIRGNRCPYCANKPVIDVEFVDNEFSKEGYTLLSKEYLNASTKLYYRCPNYHEYFTTWASWQQGSRCLMCYRFSIFGDGNPSWKGGISCEPYCDAWADKEFKESIKERDNYECQNPDCWGTSDRLTAHHIDYNKKNCKPNNLITLCNSCNSRANTQRRYWSKFYTNILKANV